MTKKRLNIIILFIALGLVLYFTLKDDLNGILLQISKTNIYLFLLSMIILVSALAIKTLGLHVFLKEYDDKYRWNNTFKLTLIAQFLNGITPFQTGGQPFEVYLLKKQGIRISDSTSALIKDFISYQIALIITGFIALIINGVLNIIKLQSGINWFIFIGFLVNLVVLAVLLMIISPSKKSRTVIKKIIEFLFKFKLTKKIGNKEQIDDGLDRFYQSGMQLRKEKKHFFISIVSNFVTLIMLYIIPYIIFKSLGLKSVNILGSISITAFVMLIGNFVPIPGATGGLEYSFVHFFSAFSIEAATLSGAMLLWRFVTYFFGMILGFICLIITRGVNKDENRTFY